MYVCISLILFENIHVKYICMYVSMYECKYVSMYVVSA